MELLILPLIGVGSERGSFHRKWEEHTPHSQCEERVLPITDEGNRRHLTNQNT